MTGSAASPSRFLIGFGLIALLVAGFISYFASSSPDGLDSATTRGCQTVETDTGETLVGDCIAKNASDHRLADSPLAGYSVNGKSQLTGVAGIIGVAATFLLAGGVFQLIARGRRRTGKEADLADPGTGTQQ